MAPTKRRRVSGPAAAAKSNASQSMLSFRSSKSTNASEHPDKVVKPTTKGKQPRVDVVEEKQRDEEYPSHDEQTSDTAGLEESKPNEPEPERNEDTRARAIKESQIKAYWAAKEKERKAPRVHQDGLSLRDKVLREFDMSSRYGPSIGKSRLERWRRAYKLNMNPPIEVLAVLLREESDRPGKSQKSIVDELMSSRTGKEVAQES